MQKSTHLIFGFGLTFFLSHLFFSDFSLGIQMIFSIFGSGIAMLSDWLDFRIAGGKYHRNKFSHNFFSPLIVLVFGTGCLVESWILGLIYVMVFESHIVLDSMTFSGVWLGWTHKIRGQVASNEFHPNFILTLFGIGLGLLGLIC